MKSLLIISNNVLSTTNNNGKTIYSFVEGMKDVTVSQLFLSGEVPKISGYNYFRISDKDVIRGILRPAKRGNCICAKIPGEARDDFSIKKKVGKNIYTLLFRDILWFKRWKSKNLLDWLDNVKPDAIFFVAGDSLFAYDICTFVQNKYGSRLTVYITDDYVMPRSEEKKLQRFRRNRISSKLDDILKVATCFYTISTIMRTAYKEKFGIDSYLAVNMTDDLKCDSYLKEEKEIIFTYAGSFYYKRSEVLGRLAKAIKKYNEHKNALFAKLLMYSNTPPTEDIYKEICIDGASEYRGSLNNSQLRERLNTSDILVFVESFESEQIEKVKYSLSTKVPEYMSLGKPILAIGPTGIGSMDYLRDVAICVNDINELDKYIAGILDKSMNLAEYAVHSREKYLKNHNTEILRTAFYNNVIGGEVEVHANSKND